MTPATGAGAKQFAGKFKSVLCGSGNMGASVFAVIVLVIILGGPELFGGFDRSDDVEALFAQLLN